MADRETLILYFSLSFFFAAFHIQQPPFLNFASLMFTKQLVFKFPLSLFLSSFPELSSRYYSLTLSVVIRSVPLPLHSGSGCSRIHSSTQSSLIGSFHFLAPRTATTRLYFLNLTKTEHPSW